jgi:hypothetical protein
MALQDNSHHLPQRESEEQISGRFLIAQDGKPSQEQLDFQASLRETFSGLAVRINREVTDGREKSLSITHLEEALMWAGKAIFS